MRFPHACAMLASIFPHNCTILHCKYFSANDRDFFIVIITECCFRFLFKADTPLLFVLVHLHNDRNKHKVQNVLVLYSRKRADSSFYFLSERRSNCNCHLRQRWTLLADRCAVASWKHDGIGHVFPDAIPFITPLH